MIKNFTSAEAPTVYEDEATGDRFLIYGTPDGVKLEIRYEGDTLWMNQAQISELFGISVQTVNHHLRNIYAEGELEETSTFRDFRIVRSEGERQVAREVKHYNLDAIISVGYRVSSKQGTLFRRWATDRLVQFATKGFVIDTQRLKNPDSADRIAELREIIRDIRSDEANVYRELRSICAMCQDYDGESNKWREFYTRMQAKLMWAVTSHTPSEIIAERADASQPNMGLRTWPNENIRKADVCVSKNYLESPEIKELNRLTTILLDIFEDQLDIGKLVTMSDAELLLDRQLKQLNRVVLRHGGSIKTAKAKKLAELQYTKFDKERKRLRHEEADRAIADLKKSDKQLPKTRTRRRSG